MAIDSERGVSFIGPFDVASADRLLTTLAMRDVLIIQDALQQREDEACTGHEGATALLCAMRGWAMVRIDEVDELELTLAKRRMAERVTALVLLASHVRLHRVTRDSALDGVPSVLGVWSVSWNQPWDRWFAQGPRTRRRRTKLQTRLLKGLLLLEGENGRSG